MVHIVYMLVILDIHNIVDCGILALCTGLQVAQVQSECDKCRSESMARLKLFGDNRRDGNFRPPVRGKNLDELFRFLANMQNSDDTIASIAERC